jgi:membrane fusion protein (multidrug efflux system)
MRTTTDRPEDSLAGPPPPPLGDEMETRRRFPWLQIAFAALAVGAAVYFTGHWLLYDRYRVYTEDAMIDTDQVYVTAKVSERVDRVLVDENQFVRRGQLLVVLDDANERAALDLAQQNLVALRATTNAARHATSLEAELESAQVREQTGGADAARKSVSLAQSQADAAMRGIAVAEAQVTSARAQLTAAEAAVPGAQEALHKAQTDRDRQAALEKQGYVATSALDTAVAALSAAQSAYDAAVAQRTAARSAVDTAIATLAQQRANVAAAQRGTSASAAQVPIADAKISEVAAPSRIVNKQDAADAAGSQADAMAAQVRLAQLALAATRVVAPVDGWVAARNAEEGQTLTIGQQIVTLSPANRIYVTANYKETQLDRIRPGMPVEISVDACGGAKVRGKVIGFAPIAQNALSTLPTLTAPTNFVKVAQRVGVRIALPPSGGSCVFRPGTAVETAVVTH